MSEQQKDIALAVNIDVMPGAHLQDAIEQTVELATTLGICLRIQPSGVLLYVFPGATPEQVRACYEEGVRRGEACWE